MNIAYDNHHIGSSNWTLLAQFLSDLNAEFKNMLIMILRGA